jgi:thiol-disulfide isomerase/thioredoxin
MACQFPVISDSGSLVTLSASPVNMESTSVTPIASAYPGLASNTPPSRTRQANPTQQAYPGIDETIVAVATPTLNVIGPGDPYPEPGTTATAIIVTPTSPLQTLDPYPDPLTQQTVNATQSPTPTSQQTSVDPYPGSTMATATIGISTNTPLPSVTGNALASSTSTPIFAQTAIATPTPTPVIFQTPTLLPTATMSPTPTPTPTWTPLVPPPWIDSEIRATDPSTVDLVANKIQLVWFFAFWDGPSQAMSPIVHALENDYAGQMNFIYLDIDDPENQVFKDALFYRGQPQFFLLDHQGEVLKQWQGYVTNESFVDAIEAAHQ